MSNDEFRYHSDRAMQELDRGLVAPSAPAARAHLKLSSLHMEKARSLAAHADRTKPPFVM
ncbi:MAG: hypothetical protein ACK4K7_02785 [Allosphingosinicella sp.]|uniref:hypothetical protein n=1 Tax=Allosphingosinicella sp. TaxID=2823234 RepID=UPI00393EB303